MVGPVARRTCQAIHGCGKEDQLAHKVRGNIHPTQARKQAALRGGGSPMFPRKRQLVERSGRAGPRCPTAELGGVRRAVRHPQRLAEQVEVT